MATVYIQLPPQAWIPDATLPPQHNVVDGTNYPVAGINFDAATVGGELVFATFRAVNYGSGNLTVDIEWYADTATSGDVVWGAAIAAITPNTDTQDIETDALATEATVTGTHLGTTGQRLHRATITVSSIDGIAADDYVTIRLRRLSDDAADTMTGDAVMTMATVSYSDV